MTIPAFTVALSRIPSTRTTVMSATMPKARMLKTIGTPNRLWRTFEQTGILAAYGSRSTASQE